MFKVYHDYNMTEEITNQNPQIIKALIREGGFGYFYLIADEEGEYDFLIFSRSFEGGRIIVGYSLTRDNFGDVNLENVKVTEPLKVYCKVNVDDSLFTSEEVVLELNHQILIRRRD